jgi:ABC-type bacteriocin/lantibiotic exporter with double-glycine peptidase domain
MNFKFNRQLDFMDCGPACLLMIANHYGKQYSLQYLRSRSFISNSGISMLGISDAAENIGFRTRGYKLTWEQLRDEVPLPCIVHWNQGHFVVVYDIKKRRGAWGMGHRAQGTERRAGSRGRGAGSRDFASRFRRTKAVAFFDHHNPDCPG